MTLDNAKSRANAMKKCILNTYLSFLFLLLAAYRKSHKLNNLFINQFVLFISLIAQANLV